MLDYKVVLEKSRNVEKIYYFLQINADFLDFLRNIKQDMNYSFQAFSHLN